MEKTTTGPSPAERARTVLARAASADIRWLDRSGPEGDGCQPDQIQLVSGAAPAGVVTRPVECERSWNGQTGRATPAAAG